MANNFNKYFSSVGSLTALKADQLARDQNWTLDSNAYETSNVSSPCEQFEFQPVSENDVANVILNLPSNKAPGFDKVSARILQDSLPATLQIITSMMNNSFKSNTFARVWKFAEVTCVPKDGDAGNPCNNRPISLLPVLSKVNERLAQRQFVTFLDGFFTFLHNLSKQMSLKRNVCLWNKVIIKNFNRCLERSTLSIRSKCEVNFLNVHSRDM